MVYPSRISGFTLIELMIVVAIVAILAAVAVPAYVKYVEDARFTKLVKTLQPLKTDLTVCADVNVDLNNCSHLVDGVFDGITYTIQQNGNKVTLHSSANVGSRTAFYQLTGTNINGGLQWESSCSPGFNC